jgi:hypothetical protein
LKIEKQKMMTGRGEGKEGELSKTARELLGRAALAAVALVIAVNIPVPTCAKILIFFTALVVAGITMRISKLRRPR